MKNIFLSVVVVAVLVAAGVGGTFAHFSDTEEVFDNYIATGSLDLMVSDTQGNEFDQAPYGTGIPALCTWDDVVPGKDFSFEFDLHNAGQVAKGTPFIHFKSLRCVDIPPDKGGYIDLVDGMLKPEPELVAESGGWVGQVWVPGIGDIDCFLSRHIEVRSLKVSWDKAIWTDVPIIQYDEDGNNIVKLNELECHNIRLLPLLPTEGSFIPPCNFLYVDVHLYLQDIDEDELIADGILVPPAIPADGDGGYFNGEDPEIQLKCWDKWPTNALMKDKLYFDILCSLTQFDP